jgi:hypothetical protein
VWFLGRAKKLTVAHHNLAGANRFAQAATEFPYCFISYSGWCECPFDLYAVRWYRTPDEAVAQYGNQDEKPVSVAFTGKRYSAVCGKQHVTLVRDQGKGGRWSILVGCTKRNFRRHDFSSPFVQHAMRTAEEWFGEPKGAWREESESK